MKLLDWVLYRNEDGACQQIYPHWGMIAATGFWSGGGGWNGPTRAYLAFPRKAEKKDIALIIKLRYYHISAKL